MALKVIGGLIGKPSESENDDPTIREGDAVRLPRFLSLIGLFLSIVTCLYRFSE